MATLAHVATQAGSVVILPRMSSNLRRSLRADPLDRRLRCARGVSTPNATITNVPSPTPKDSSQQFELHAWIDESMPRVSDGQPGVYILAAVVADPRKCEQMRSSMNSLSVGKEPKLHWHAEKTARRRKIVTTVAGFDINSIVVIATPLDERRQERARAQCLDALLIELDQLGVCHAYLEQREKTLNRRDLQHIDRLRGTRTISASLRIEVARPSVEPMLWIPDTICGSVGAAQHGEPEWVNTLGSGIRMVPITLR